MKPTVGRIVYFCHTRNLAFHAAIVTAVCQDGRVFLTIFAPSQTPLFTSEPIEYDDTDPPQPGTWRWPPRE